MRFSRDTPKRVLFYSHDTLGLGHLRRTLLICSALRERFPDFSYLILTGSAMAHAFHLPPGTDYVKLPSAVKLDNELYASRSLGLNFEELRRMRQEIIFQTTAHYLPDFIFVDNVPLGMKSELLSTLSYVRNFLPASRIFLVLRDILDDQMNIVPVWKRLGVFDALERLYDRILICGQPQIFDGPIEYEFPESVRTKTRFCGYFPRPFSKDRAHRYRQKLCQNGQKLVLVTVGGGSDGVGLVKAYLRALPRISRETSVATVVLLGPEMQPEWRRRLRTWVGSQAEVVVADFTNDSVAYMEAADLVVSMAGFNTVNEIVWLKKRAVVYPRVHPRSEQLIRSQRMADLGLLRFIRPEHLTPDKLANMILTGLKSGPPTYHSRLSFSAPDKIAAELEAYLGKSYQEESLPGVLVSNR